MGQGLTLSEPIRYVYGMNQLMNQLMTSHP